MSFSRPTFGQTIHHECQPSHLRPDHSPRVPAVPHLARSFTMSFSRPTFGQIIHHEFQPSHFRPDHSPRVPAFQASTGVTTSSSLPRFRTLAPFSIPPHIPPPHPSTPPNTPPGVSTPTPSNDPSAAVTRGWSRSHWGASSVPWTSGECTRRWSWAGAAPPEAPA